MTDANTTSADRYFATVQMHLAGRDSLQALYDNVKLVATTMLAEADRDISNAPDEDEETECIGYWEGQLRLFETKLAATVFGFVLAPIAERVFNGN